MAELIAGLIDVFADAPMTGSPLAAVQDQRSLQSPELRGRAKTCPEMLVEALP
jgi:predicted PhzF superfamily epimerase YddE/YHI9